MTSKNEITETGTHEIAEPTQLGRGFEAVDASEISMPRAKLLQSNSPEVSDRDYNFRAGDIVHTLLLEKLPEKFVPLSIWSSNILFVPREDDKKAAMKAVLNLSDEDMAQSVVCRSLDAKVGDRYGNCASCGLCKFKGNEKPLCNATINVLIVPINEDGELTMPVVLQFSSTSYKHGKKFRDMAFYSSIGADLFSRMYKLDAFENKSNGNKWFEMKIKPAGIVSDDMKPQLEAMFVAFAGKTIVVESEDESAEAEDVIDF